MGFGHVLAYHTPTADRLGQGTAKPGRHKLDGAPGYTPGVPAPERWEEDHEV